jgi:hypothetical protein
LWRLAGQLGAEHLLELGRNLRPWLAGRAWLRVVTLWWPRRAVLRASALRRTATLTVAVPVATGLRAITAAAKVWLRWSRSAVTLTIQGRLICAPISTATCATAPVDALALTVLTTLGEQVLRHLRLVVILFVREIAATPKINGWRH